MRCGEASRQPTLLDSQMRWPSREDHCNQEESHRERTDPQPSVTVNVLCDPGTRHKAANKSGAQKHKRRRYGFHPFLRNSCVFNDLETDRPSTPSESSFRGSLRPEPSLRILRLSASRQCAPPPRWSAINAPGNQTTGVNVFATAR